jgi:ABC-2 type transport system permease protein
MTASAPSTTTTAGALRKNDISSLRLSLNAFIALLWRDIAVIGRNAPAFLAQAVMQPLFFLFIFGKVMPSIGLTASGFQILLLPGIVGMTTILTAMQGISLDLSVNLGYTKEIEDRLLAPIHEWMVAVEMLVFAVLRGLVSGAVIFPLGALILGSGFEMRTDRLGLLALLMTLSALAGACLGLYFGTIVKPQHIALMFTLVFTPLLFTGCSYYPWAALNHIRWFQILTLVNPLTYADEGIRYAMVPANRGFHISTLGLPWVFLGLIVTSLAFGLLGTRSFVRRVVG